jgi:hypothetical protein
MSEHADANSYRATGSYRATSPYHITWQQTKLDELVAGLLGGLPEGGTPLWLGFKDIDKADPAAALAALAFS